MTQNPKTPLKSSNIPWIWEIPENWEVRRLKYLTPDNRYYPIWDWDHWAIKPDMYQDKGIPYFRVQNLTWSWEVSYDWMVYISEETHKNNPKSILYPNDILIAKTGATIWKLSLIPSSISEANTTSSVWKISLNHQKYNVRFILYSMMSPYFKNQYELDAYEKSAQPWFNIEDLINYVLVIPPLPTQAAIANFLDKKTIEIKKFIENKRKLINLLKEQKQSIIHRAVTKGIDPNAKMKDSGIPWIWEIPESWTTTKLKFLLKHLTDWSHISVKSISEWHPYVTVANIDEQTWKIDLEGCQKISDEDYAILMGNWCKPKIWDILFSQIGTIWLTVEVKENDNFVMLSSLAILSPNNVLVDTQFLITYLRSSVIKEQYLLKMDWGAVKRITLNHIANFNINLPSIEIQHSIVDYIEKEVTQIDSAVYKIEQEITLIEEYRTSLIYQAVTGKIQIN